MSALHAEDSRLCSQWNNDVANISIQTFTLEVISSTREKTLASLLAENQHHLSLLLADESNVNKDHIFYFTQTS